MKNNWIVYRRKYDNIIHQLMANRGIDPDYFDDFTRPDFQQDLLSPKLLPDYNKFTKRLHEALTRGEKIGIFADYDADGTPGAALLARALSELKLEYEVYIPTRDEGYGLSVKGIDQLRQSGCNLVITVDLGIKSVSEASYCLKNKIDLIITDHHLPGENLPQAYAIINPKIESSQYPYKDLCGCGLIYKIIFGLQEFYPNKIDEKFLKWNLDLAAISTISDVVPLTGENRTIAKYGLIVLNRTKNLGLQKLIGTATLEKGKIGAYQVGYMIGPRLNAPGRIKDARKAFELLVTEDAQKANDLARELDEENSLRQKEMNDLIEAAQKEVELQKLNKNKIIVLHGPWSKGVIGPSASQIAEKYCRPTIIFSDRDEEYTGSARTFKGVDIFEIISKTAKYLIKFGGHKGAAGLAVSRGQYKSFVEAIIDVAENTITDDDLITKYKIDAEVNFSDLSFNLLENIELLEPYGLGNPRPLFMSRNVAICQPKTVGKNNNHLSMMLEHENRRIKSIYFSHPFEDNEIQHGLSADVVYSVNIDHWNGNRYLNINVADMDIHEKR